MHAADEIRLFSSHKRKCPVSPQAPPSPPSPPPTPRPEGLSEPRPLADGVFPAEDVAFEKLGLTQWLGNTCRVYGMLRPTDVQAVCIPQILEGRPVIGVAQTGSGKTATFALPVLQKLAKDPYGIFALVLTPTRELAFQISDIFKALSTGMAFRHCVIVGGLKIRSQVLSLSKRPHVVVSTPGRLASIVDSDGQLSGFFKRLAFFVVDEADQILDASFESDLRKIISILPQKRQTLLFSATMTKNLIRLQKLAMPNAFVYQVYEEMQTVPTLQQEYVFVPQNVKNVYLYHLIQKLEDMDMRSIIIFASTCASCRLLGHTLEHLGCHMVLMHSDIKQRQRLRHLEQFKSRQVPILVATDLASRGLDIPCVDLVINYDLPHLPRDYVHRVGRTARVGRSGRALSFVTQYDIELLHGIEKLIKVQLKGLELEEEAVLKDMRRVFVAKKAAMLQVKREQKEEQDRNKAMQRQ